MATEIFHTTHSCNSIQLFYPAKLNLHVHSSCCDTSIAFFLHLETAHPHHSPTFRSFPCWVPVVIWAMCYQEWQMITWLRSHIHKSSRTRYTDHHNNRMITSSHIQIINLKVKVLPASPVRTGTWSRFSSTHARPFSRRAAVPPHIQSFCQWQYTDNYWKTESACIRTKIPAFN